VPGPDLIIPFERLSRAIHRTVLLQLKIAEPASPEPLPAASRPATTEPDEPAPGATPPDEPPPATDPAQTPAAQTPTGRATSPERLDLRDLEAEIENRPIPDLIADIRRDYRLVLDPNQPDEPRPAPDAARRFARSPRILDIDEPPEVEEIWNAGLTRCPEPPPSG
jgi:hypothetical protein